MSCCRDCQYWVPTMSGTGINIGWGNCTHPKCKNESDKYYKDGYYISHGTLRMHSYRACKTRFVSRDEKKTDKQLDAAVEACIKEYLKEDNHSGDINIEALRKTIKYQLGFFLPSNFNKEGK